MAPSRRVLVAVVSVLACSGLVACGGTTPTASASNSKDTKAEAFYEKYMDMSMADRHDALVAAAEKEGEFSIYTSGDRELVDAFAKDYPKIKVKVYEGTSDDVMQRVLQETSANRTLNDVVDTQAFTLDKLNDAGVLGSYDSDAVDKFLPAAKSLTGHNWIPNRFSVFTAAWNTEKVSGSKVPTSYLDFAKPEWKGEVAMELSDYEWYGTLHTYLIDKKGMSKDDVESFFRKVAKNAKVVDGHTNMDTFLAAGRFSAVISGYKHQIDGFREDKGAPVASLPALEPLILLPDGQAVMRNAKHPAAAMLFTDWVLTKGQELFVKDYRVPAVEGTPGSEELLPKGVDTEIIGADITAKDSQWSKAYENLLQGAPKVSG